MQHPEMSATPMVNLTAAANALGVNKSTLSRNLKDGMFRNYGTNARPLVIVAEVKAGRSRGVDPMMRRQAAEPVIEPPLDLPPPTAAEEAASSVVAARSRLLQAQAEEAERKNLVAAGKLVDRTETEEKFQTVATQLRDELMVLGDSLAGDLVNISDAGTIAALIRDRLREALVRMTESFRREQG